MADLVFISGGARSGKSRWALALGDEYMIEWSQLGCLLVWGLLA